MTKKKTKNDSSFSNSNDISDRKRHEQPLQAVLLTEDWEVYHHTSDMMYDNDNDDDNDDDDDINDKIISNIQMANTVSLYPLVYDVPKVLYPVVNQTMIDYTIQYLYTQHVQEVYIVCVSQQVEDYITTKYSYHHQQA